MNMEAPANGIDFLKEALRLAGLGYPVFPLAPRSKIPLKRPALGLTSGFKDASTNPEVITRWFTALPNANLAVAPPRGTLVLDFDLPDALAPFLSDYPELNTAPRSRTGSGGWHLWLRSPPDIQATTRIIPELALDLRTGGRSYLVAPPSVHPKTGNRWRWIVPLTSPPTALPVLPPRLLSRLQRYRDYDDLIDTDSPPPARIPPPADDSLRSRQRKYAQKELDSRCREMAATQPGSRHQQLFRHAVALTGWYRAGALEYEEILTNLLDAATSTGLSEREARNTIEWAIKKSAIKPRSLEAVGQ